MSDLDPFETGEHTIQWFERALRAAKRWGPRTTEFLKFATSEFFYHENLVRAFLRRHEPAQARSSSFIHYDKWRQMYPDLGRTFQVRLGDEHREDRVGYVEEIDFIRNPQARILVRSTGTTDPSNLPSYVPPAVLDHWSEAFERYLEAKPHTTNGPIVRLASLKKAKSQDTWLCRLERAGYFDQVRTNLTLDTKVDGQTLRSYDKGRSGGLPTLEESILVNSIGVSAVVFFEKHVDAAKPPRRFMFMKRRHKDEGVFDTGMFGTTSGVLSVAGGQRVHELVSYAQAEMLREFYSETGIRSDPTSVVRITPLALVRELTRGGKPQFFFLIQVPAEVEKGFRSTFKRSEEGLEEFRHSLLEQVIAYGSALSPEFAANLYYALRALNVQEGLPADPIHL